jgi:hypothetical protein
LPILLAAMERNGHLHLRKAVRSQLLSMSAATIDRALHDVREAAGGRRRRHAAPSAAVRRSVPVRTFTDWHDPPPGFFEADLVAHSGPSARGSFVQTLVLTDIATGWTECAPLLIREQTLLVEALKRLGELTPVAVRGFDSDNDSVFMNETVRDYCQAEGITFTRSRPYRKNDQAWVEQKNGAVVRRIVGYRRFEGTEAAALGRSARHAADRFPLFRGRIRRREQGSRRRRGHPVRAPADRAAARRWSDRRGGAGRRGAAIGHRVAGFCARSDLGASRLLHPPDRTAGPDGRARRSVLGPRREVPPRRRCLDLPAHPRLLHRQHDLHGPEKAAAVILADAQ